MATRQTSMHTFSGKLGSTVGYQKFGDNLERILGKSFSPKNPKTQKQLMARAKFTLLNNFLNRINGFIEKPFRSSTMPARSACYKLNHADTVGGTYPNYEVIYNKFRVSKGSILLPYSPSAVVDSQSLNLSWTDNSGIDNANADDQAMILVYNSAKVNSVYTFTGGTREGRQGSITLPTAWSGDSVDVWMAMSNADQNKFSESVYLGNFSI